MGHFNVGKCPGFLYCMVICWAVWLDSACAAAFDTLEATHLKHYNTDKYWKELLLESAVHLKFKKKFKL